MVDVVKRGRGRPRKNEVVEKPARGRGHPSFEPKPAQRRHVEEMISGGMRVEEIASALEITPPTLRKYFGLELAKGAARKRADLIGMLFKAGRKGNVSAIKRLLEMNEVTLAQEQMKDRERGGGGTPPAAEVEEPVAKPVKLGKKEARQQIADGVTGIYAPPEPPKLVVNNRK